MRDIKAIECTCGLGAVVVGLGLYSYYVRELLASLALFAGAFFVVGLLVLGAFLFWCACEKATTWAQPTSRYMIAFSRRLMAAYAKS